MKTIIENKTTHHKEAIETASGILSNSGFEKMKLYISIYCPELLVGKGGHHIWYSDSLTGDRLAITYLDC